MEKESRFFQEALSNFMYDAASGSAIRHLVDSGLSVDQIVERLDYPTARSRVERTVYAYMTETGILLRRLPAGEDSFSVIHPGKMSRGDLRRLLLKLLEKNGEAQSYMLCPFGRCGSSGIPESWLSGLTAREREYVAGIPWEPGLSYHRLTGRMFEIGLQLAVTWELESRFYFLGTGEAVITAGNVYVGGGS